MARKEVKLTGLELEIMQVLWQGGPRTVAAVQAAMKRDLAYTTVQTVLNTLHRKGKLRRRLDGRAYMYSAAVTEAKALRHAVRDLIDRMFGGSSEQLVLSLLKSRDLDLARIGELSRELEREKVSAATAKAGSDEDDYGREALK